MNKTFTVTKMEFKRMAMNKGFIITTLLGPFFIIALAVLPSFFAQSSMNVTQEVQVGITGVSMQEFRRIEGEFADTTVDPEYIESREEGIQLVSDEELEGFVVLPGNYTEVDSYQYFSLSGTSMGVFDIIESSIGDVIVRDRMEEAGLDPERITQLSSVPSLEPRQISREGQESAQDFSSIFFTAFAFIMILYMTVLLYGQGIGRSVLQEKTQKTVEILLSSVKPNHLLMGKILGMTAAGLLQYAVWISMAGIALTLAQPIFGVSVPIQLSYVNLIWLLVFFVLGFLVFASAYAALGAASQDEQNLGQLSWPIMLFLIIPIVMSSGIIMNPESTVAIGMSLFPLTAPIIMFARILVGAPAVWEIALSIGLLAATAFGISYLSAKIFRVGLLMSGKKTSIQEVVKWLSFKA